MKPMKSAKEIVAVKASEVQVGDDIQLESGEWGRVRLIGPSFYRRALAFTYTCKGQTDLAHAGKRQKILVRRSV